MKTNLKYFGWILLLYTCTLGACRDKENEPTPDGHHNLVSATLAGNVSKEVLQVTATAYGYGNAVALIKHDVSLYRLVYKTAYKGQEIEASGLLAIPRGTASPPAIISAQHGTMFRNADAPSNFPGYF